MAEDRGTGLVQTGDLLAFEDDLSRSVDEEAVKLCSIRSVPVRVDGFLTVNGPVAGGLQGFRSLRSGLLSQNRPAAQESSQI